MNKNAISTICFLAVAGLMISAPANAQSQYEYCRDQASRITGYYGESPRSHRRGQVAKGAATGAALGAIFAKKGKKGKAAKRGAAIGALIGAAKKGAAKDKARRKRRDYNYELDRCMRDGVGPSDYRDDRYRDDRRDDRYRDDRYRDDRRRRD